MAPIASVMGIDDDQRFALMKFRRSVKDVLKPEHNDHFLLRWLIARQWDADAAEKMLRASLKWREKWAVDSLLDSRQPPKMEKYVPCGQVGFDKEGSPVVIVPFISLDIVGLLHAATKSDMIRIIIRVLETNLAIARKQAETHGPAALKVTVIFDLDGFNIREFAWKPATQLVFSCLQMYEANYPEILKVCYVVNAPAVFSLAFAIVKKFIREQTIEKIQIYGNDARKWQAKVLSKVDKDQLPVYYGGTLMDETGDPRCPTIVNLGGKVPKSLYLKNIQQESEKEYTHATVKTGDKLVVDLLCGDGESALQWDVGIDSHDIKFVIKKREQSGAESVIYGPVKLQEGPAEIGVLPVTGPATISVIFDNKSSYLRSKKIYYDVAVTANLTELVTDTPEDNTAL
ncbi:SEC14-like protein 2 [Aricia agestis]|uniref:SEC14-like protein 2 n=1 Tax=Aricia agestis TaxID=91739 RepID=UPI001C2033B7|nr:SEC14-like protein 2 [Aricia agestis]